MVKQAANSPVDLCRIDNNDMVFNESKIHIFNAYIKLNIMDAGIQAKIDQWLNGNYDQQTKATIKELAEKNV